MTNKEMDKILCEYFGWEWISCCHIKDDSGNYIVDGTLWHPTENIAQAFMCLDKYTEDNNLNYKIHTNKYIPVGQKVVDILDRDYVRIEQSNDDSLSQSICQALIKTIKGSK